MQTLLTEGPLLDDHGNLVQAGYATSLVKQYERGKVKAGKTRTKEWDYYLIYNDRFGVALTVDDNSYMGLVSISFLDFQKKTERTVSRMSAFPFGKTRLPESSAQGVTHYHDQNCFFSFRTDPDRRLLLAHMENFDQKQRIRMKIELTQEPEDSMVIATPFQKPKHFYYNQKIIGMRAKGSVEYLGSRYSFSPEDSFGLLDWGRGAWTYKNTWYWGAVQGICDGKVLGLNLGYGFGDTSAASENMVFYDGKAHKLDRVVFHIPGEEEGKTDFLKPWRITSSDNRLQLDFSPILDRASNTNALLIQSDQHQIFGWFDGYVILDSKEKLLIRHMLGFAEKVKNRW